MTKEFAFSMNLDGKAPTVSFVTVQNEDRARGLAEQLLARSPRAVSIDVIEGGLRRFTVIRNS
jgi:hypothetical protein